MTSCDEGLALSIIDCYGAKINRKDNLYLAGGASKSKILPQLISNTLNVKVKILTNSELGALGISFSIDSYLNKKGKLEELLKFIPYYFKYIFL